MDAPRARLAPKQVAALVATTAGLLVAAQGLRLYLLDGSYFHSEASVVLALEGQSALETFQGKLLGGGQNFPRFYLLAVRGVRAVLGDSTLATRLLPQLFFLAATGLWAALLWRRFRERPALVALGGALLLAVPAWAIYGAAIKQYSFDAFCVLALFAVPERFFDEALGAGRRRRRLAAMVVPVFLSFTYGVALLARVLGWWAHRWRSESVEGRERRWQLGVEPVSALLLAGGFALGSGLLYATDVRHTLTQDTLFTFWKQCTLSASPGETVPILEAAFFGLYDGRSEWLAHQPLHAGLRIALLSAFALGAIRIGLGILGLGRAAEPPWGSRSAGCLAGTIGLVATSWVIDFPLCPGRLLLYALFFQQVVLLEGFATAADGLRAGAARIGGAGFGTAAAGLFVLCLAVLVAARAVEATQDLASRTPIEDVRQHLGKLETAPALPVIVTGCMERQIRALPEGLGDREVVIQELFRPNDPLPPGEEIWVIHSRFGPGICFGLHEMFRALTSDAPREVKRPGQSVMVYRTRVLTREELAGKKRRPGALKAFDRNMERWQRGLERAREGGP